MSNDTARKYRLKIFIKATDDFLCKVKEADIDPDTKAAMCTVLEDEIARLDNELATLLLKENDNDNAIGKV